MRHEFDDERFVGGVAENRLLQQINCFLRKDSAVLRVFRTTGSVLFAEHFQAARASAVVEGAHLRAGHELVAVGAEDDVELLADGFVNDVQIHPGAT